ncbi:MAG: AMP-binding protein [Chloroflexi bacterium]|nr:AMP-binding protein [Chloroflexota bacterium]
MNDDWSFPLLDDAGRALLQSLRENSHAPRYTHPGCDRVTAQGLERVRAFETELKTSPRGWQHRELAPWLADFVAMCFADVPFYRRYGSPSADFFSIPTCSRADIAREPWSFVPDSVPLDDIALYQTSGTTGHPLNVITHPEPLAMYIPLMRAALATHGVTLDDSNGKVAVVLVCFQKSTWTYISISPFLDNAGFVKVNLNPDDWRDADDRARFLDDCNPQIYTGDPISFAELAKLPLQTRPRALVSTSMAMLPGLQRQLETRFNCPVINIYSMNETGPIAVAQADGFELLHHRLYVEILDPNGVPCEPGTRGEIIVSGGFNPFLPLLRYRTGDYAGLQFRGQIPVLVGLEGRQPVVFRGERGRRINNIDISTVLKPFALTQYSLHQFADGSLRLRVRGAIGNAVQLRDAILALFGAGQRLDIECVDSLGDKVIQYTSEIPNGEES